MPHATMDPRRHASTGEPHENVYYTLQPARPQPSMHHDNYGSLPSHARTGYTDFPSSHSINSSPMQSQSNYGTLPSQHSQLPSYSSGGTGPYAPMGSYNALPAQGGSYGTLPSHHELGSRSVGPAGYHQQGQMSQNRELPAPSLTRHSMKILQVPILVVGEDNRDSLISRGSSSPSASPSSTISDPGTTPTYVPRSQPMHIGSSSSVQRPGQVQVQVESVMGTPPGSYGQGSFPTHQSGQHPKFPPATQTQGSSQHHNKAGQTKAFPHSDMTSHGAFPHSGVPSHGYVNAATLPHRSSSAIPTHLQQQRPSPSSSPGSTTSLPASIPHPNHQHHSQHMSATLPHSNHPHHTQPMSATLPHPNHPHHTQPMSATLPHPNHPHHNQHMHSASQPLVRPDPTPSPVPRQPTVQILPAQSHPAQTFRMHNQNPDSLSASHNNNKYNTFPGPMSQLVESPKVMSQLVENPKVMSQLVENPKSGLGPAPMMDISGKMWSMQEDMQRMQKQMEDSFRNMHVAPPALGNPSSSFPDFPSIMPPQPFGGMQPPSYADLATHASPSPLSMSTPSLVEPDFGRMMSSDMGIGTPIVQDTLDDKGGKKQLKLNLDMHEFAPGEVKVRSDKNKLEVTAHHEEKDPNRITCRVFKQQYHLPENTRMAKLQYDMTPDGELQVEGTVKPRHRVKWSADTLTK